MQTEVWRRKWLSAEVQTLPTRANPPAQAVVLPLALPSTALGWARTEMATLGKHPQQELPCLSSWAGSALTSGRKTAFSAWGKLNLNCSQMCFRMLSRTSHGLGMLREFSRKKIHVHWHTMYMYIVCASWLPSEKYAFPNFLWVRDTRFSSLHFLLHYQLQEFLNPLLDLKSACSWWLLFNSHWLQPVWGWS